MTNDLRVRTRRYSTMEEEEEEEEEEEGDTRCIIPGEIILRMRRGRTGPAVAGIGGISHRELSGLPKHFSL